MERKIKLGGFLIALTGAILFSTKAIFVKLAFRETGVDAVTLLTLRMLFSLPFYLVAAWLGARKEKNTRLGIRDWLSLLALGILGYYLSSLFDFIGLQYVSAGLERLILFLYPSFAVLINTFIFRISLSRYQIIALLLTYLGIGIAYFGELRLDTGNPHFYYGSLLIFLCAVTYSIYLVGTGRMVHKTGITRYTAYTMLAATGGIFVHYLLTHSWQSVRFTPVLWYYCIGLSLVATVLPSFFLSNSMKKIGSNNVSIVTSIGPVSTILQAHWVLGERIIPAQIIGTALVIIGVLLIGWKSGDQLPAGNS
ncbi:MAG TPA: DMT family transporter [Sediminibacterium sp.]|nr:DMT family transporter [Sediminibacterium sp.]